MKWLKVAIATGGFLAAACGLVINLDEAPPDDGDVGTDMDVDSDNDVDTDSDVDSDADSDTGSDIPCVVDADCGDDGDDDRCTFFKCHNSLCGQVRSTCDDGLECTEDHCDQNDLQADPITGCKHEANDELCAERDVCSPGACQPASDIHDARGCVYRAVACAEVECSAGSCVPTEAGPVCAYDFGDPCGGDGENVCIPGVGCEPAWPIEDTPCESEADCDLALGDPGNCSDWACVDFGAYEAFCNRVYECDVGESCDPDRGCVDLGLGG